MDLSSPVKDRTLIPCAGRQILNPWTTREVPRQAIQRETNPAHSRQAARLRALSPAFLLCLPGCGPKCSPCQLSRTERSGLWAFSHCSLRLAVLPLFFHLRIHLFSSRLTLPSQQSRRRLMGRAGDTSFWGSRVLSLRQCLGRRPCHRVDAACWAALPLPLGSECLEGRPTFLLTPQPLVLVTVPGN